MDRTLMIAIRDDGADADRLEQLSSALRRELLDLDVDHVEMASAGNPPPGTRGVDVTTLGLLMVAFQESVPLIVGIIGLVQAWLNSPRGARGVEISIGDQTLKIDSASRDQQDRLVDEFIAAVARSREPAAPTSTPTP